MKRIPEPLDLMDHESQAQAYANADFSEANQLFMDSFRLLCPEYFSGTALDLGCGPADISLRFARAYPDSRIDAVDGAEAMLSEARAAVLSNAELAAQISLHCLYLPTSELPMDNYQAILSNSLLHHLKDPMDLWRMVKQHGASGSYVLVMDLARPENPAAVDRLVDTYATHEPEILQRDFRLSLFAAYTPEEVKHQLQLAGLDYLEVCTVSDRHWTVSGRLA